MEHQLCPAWQSFNRNHTLHVKTKAWMNGGDCGLSRSQNAAPVSISLGAAVIQCRNHDMLAILM
jgi:hypothetical protein